jgi:hypothetical protein
MDAWVEVQEETASPSWAFFRSWNFMESPAPASERLFFLFFGLESASSSCGEPWRGLC